MENIGWVLLSSHTPMKFGCAWKGSCHKFVRRVEGGSVPTSLVNFQQTIDSFVLSKKSVVL